MGGAAQKGQVVELAADGGDFLHLDHLFQGTDDAGSAAWQDTDGAVGAHGGLFQFGAQAQAVALDDAFALQARETRDYRSARQAQLAGQGSVGGAGVLLQQVDELPVGWIEFGEHRGCLPGASVGAWAADAGAIILGGAAQGGQGDVQGLALLALVQRHLVEHRRA